MKRHPHQFAPVNPRKPVILTIASLLYAGLLAAAQYFRIPLSDNVLAFDFALVYIIAGIVGSILVVAWMVWLWFFSGWSGFWSRFVPLVTAVAIVAGMIGYRPVFRGGMMPDRWEPRFWSSRVLQTIDENRTVALAESDPLAFPQFLGPGRDATVERFNGDLSALIDARRLWKKAIGGGWSGFVVQNGLACTLQQDGEYESVICLDLETGDLQWDYRHRRRHDDPLGGAGPRTTPTLDENRLYAQGANGLLVCLDARNGQLLWEQDISQLVGVSLTEGTTTSGLAYQLEDSKVVWGRAGSPLVEGDLLIVPAGGPRDEANVSLIAFDKKTGAERWRAGEAPIGYSSPVVMTLDGVRQIVAVNESTVAGFDLTGFQLWEFAWPGNSDADANTSQATQVGINRVLVSKGYGTGGALFEVSRKNLDTWEVAEVWRNPRVLKTKLTSPVIRDDLAWGLSDGILECVDLTTGKRLWKNGRYGHGQLLRVGEFLLVHGEDGVLAVVPASGGGFQELGRVETIDGVCWNTVAVYDDCVLVRSDLEAACFRLPRLKSAASREIDERPNDTTIPVETPGGPSALPNEVGQ